MMEQSKIETVSISLLAIFLRLDIEKVMKVEKANGMNRGKSGALVFVVNFRTLIGANSLFTIEGYISRM